MYQCKSRPIRKVKAPVVLGGRTHLAVSCSPPLAPDMSTKLPAEDMENVTEGLLSKRLLEPLQLLVLKSLLRRILSEPFLDFPALSESSLLRSQRKDASGSRSGPAGPSARRLAGAWGALAGFGLGQDLGSQFVAGRSLRPGVYESRNKQQPASKVPRTPPKGNT